MEQVIREFEDALRAGQRRLEEEQRGREEWRGREERRKAAEDDVSPDLTFGPQKSWKRTCVHLRLGRGERTMPAGLDCKDVTKRSGDST